MVDDEAVEAARKEWDRWTDGYNAIAGEPLLYSVLRASNQNGRVDLRYCGMGFEVRGRFAHKTDRDKALFDLRMRAALEAAAPLIVKAEREACAKIAERFNGAAKRDRLAKGLKLGKFDREGQEIIAAEENGGDIVSLEIVVALRARADEGKSDHA